jgi:hypothetical protein
MLEQLSEHVRLEMLLSVMQSIGSLYSPMSQRHQKKIASRISPGADPVLDAFSVQCLLLNSIALYWCGEEESSREEMDLAINIALSISMQSSTFAMTHGLGNPALEESWRRTWWQLCIIDAYYAAMLHQTSPLICRLDIIAGLPCEESEYETGVCVTRTSISWTFYWPSPNSQIVPVPKTIHDFDARDFSADPPVFPAFAYLIGALRGISYAMNSRSESPSEDPLTRSYESLAVAAEGWSLLLPESAKAEQLRHGMTNELMFQAHMNIYA